MSQQALANAVGVTRQTIIAIEKNKYSPSLEVAFKIAQVFECSLEQVSLMSRTIYGDGQSGNAYATT